MLSNILSHPVLRNKKLLLAFASLLFLLQLLVLDIGVIFNVGGGQLSEGWFSDIAYNLNWEFNGRMAKDIPYGASWNTGIGKLFFLMHYFFYKIFGVGLFQARLVTFTCGVILILLLYSWVSRYISQEVAIFSTLLLILSPLFYTSLSNARQDLIHCLFGFISFYLISSGILTRKDYYFLIGGFISALSVDISFRGIEIVVAVYIYHFFFFERQNFLKRSVLLLTGSFIASIYWLAVNVFPIGIHNFIYYHLVFASGDGGTYSFETLLSEIKRFLYLFYGKGLYVFGMEIIYLILLSVVFYKNRLKYHSVSRFVILWILSVFIIMTLLEKTAGRIYLLMYYPFIFIIAGIGLHELFNRHRRLAYGMVVSILSFAVVFQSAVFSTNVYHKYFKQDYNLNGYYKKLRDSVDMNKNIIGATNHWYAFPDAQYYGGQFYLSRVTEVLKELKPIEEYKDDYERAGDLLKVFEKREVEYIIADEYFKPTIVKYFPNNELPLKNFLLVNTIADMFLGKGNESVTPPYKTEIYRVVSYEP